MLAKLLHQVSKASKRRYVQRNDHMNKPSLQYPYDKNIQDLTGIRIPSTVKLYLLLRWYCEIVGLPSSANKKYRTYKIRGIVR